MSEGKHVIFLGAGASMGSDYPSANGLRLLMTSRDAVSEKLGRYITYRDRQVDFTTEVVERMCSFGAEARQLFRYGGFATVDEFSLLAKKGAYQKYVPQLKKIMSLALRLHNPEGQFHTSEYYQFLQRLFKPDETSFRDDIVVLTFNYDCYLEALLIRALETRRRITNPGSPVTTKEANEISGGFADFSETEWQTSPKVIKLHGALTKLDTTGRILMFSSSDLSHYRRNIDAELGVPLVVFPWELFGERGKVLKLENFCPEHPTDWPKEQLHTLFLNSWNAARRAVLDAHTVSFVGLSCHYYLRGGLHYLFRGKKNHFNLIIANHANQKRDDIYESNGVDIYENSCPGRFIKLLREINVASQQRRSTFSSPLGGHALLRGSFSEFIEKDLTNELHDKFDEWHHPPLY